MNTPEPEAPTATPPHACQGGPLHGYHFTYTRDNSRIHYPGGYYPPDQGNRCRWSDALALGRRRFRTPIPPDSIP
ncbi:MAG: hypothetical protein QM755_09210 [Luteolibacter sp.]